MVICGNGDVKLNREIKTKLNKTERHTPWHRAHIGLTYYSINAFQTVFDFKKY